MTRIWFGVAVVLGLAAGTARAAEPGQAERRLSPRPDAARAVEKSEPRTVSASPAGVRKLAEPLDRAAAMVRVEFVLAEVPAGDQSGPTGPNPDAKGSGADRTEPLRPAALPKGSEILAEGELTTLENQPAYLRVGRREARVVGSSVSQMGIVNSVTFENVGTKIGLTPRVAADRTVAVQVDLEDSRLGPREAGVVIMAPDKGEPVRTPNVEMLSVQTTVRIADGKTVVIGGMARESKSGKHLMIWLTPHVMSMSGQERPRRQGSTTQSSSR